MFYESSEHIWLSHFVFEVLCVELIQEFFVDLDHYKLFFLLDIIFESVCTERNSILLSLLFNFVFDLRRNLCPITFISSQVPDKVFHDKSDRTFARRLSLRILSFLDYVLDDFWQLFQYLRWHLADFLIRKASIQFHLLNILFAYFIAFRVGTLQLFFFIPFTVFFTGQDAIHLFYNVLDVIVYEAFHLLFSLLSQKELHIIDIFITFQRIKCFLRISVTRDGVIYSQKFVSLDLF